MTFKRNTMKWGLLVLIGMLQCLPLAGFAGQNPEVRIPVELLGRNLKSRDQALTVPAQEVRQQWEKGRQVLLVDVRRKKDFEKVRIPSSINIPLDILKTKAYLKAKPLILIHQGCNYTELEQACRELRADGYSVSVLQGGLVSWRESGGELEGDPFARERLNKMAPRHAWQEKDFDNWVLVDVSPSRGATAAAFFPDSIHVPFDGQQDAFTGKLKKAVGSFPPQSGRMLLVFDQKGSYKPLEKLLAKAGLGPVFFLEGGMTAYQEYLEMLVLARDKKGNRAKSLSPCGTCAD